MSGLVYRLLGDVGDNLVVLDASRRVYVGLSREADYWHVISPALENMVNADGAVVRSAGQLVCRCRGGLFRGTCWRVKQAETFEGSSQAASDALAWLQDGAPGEVSEAFGK